MKYKPSADYWDFLDQLVSSHPPVIDRPRGSAHPRYPEITYPLDYGYLRDTDTIDGGGIDVWMGDEKSTITNHAEEVKVTALVLTIDLQKCDTEIKILLNCSEANVRTVLSFHNSNGMRALLISKPS